MVNFIDLQDLERDLTQTKAKVDSWAKQRSEFASFARDSHHENMMDQSAKLHSLEARQADLGAAAQQVKQRVEREEQEAMSLQRAATSGQLDEQALQLRVDDFRQRLAAQEQECLAMEASADIDESIKKKKLGALKKALALYSTRLALDFKQGPDELHLIFSQLDISAPSRPFIVGVKVHDDKTYEVTKCVPQVDALPELVKRLNQTNDFSEFVKSVRTEFMKAIRTGRI